MEDPSFGRGRDEEKGEGAGEKGMSESGRHVYSETLPPGASAKADST